MSLIRDLWHLSLSSVIIHLFYLLSRYTLFWHFASLYIHFYVISIVIIALRHICYYLFQRSIQPHYEEYCVILNIIHFIHTVCLNWLYRIVSIMVINQFFINISCTNTQLQPNPFYSHLFYLYCVCPSIHTIIHFHPIQCHCIYIISLIISSCFILGNSHLQFVGVVL